MSNFEELNGAVKVFCQAGEMRRHKLVRAIIAEKKGADSLSSVDTRLGNFAGNDFTLC